MSEKYPSLCQPVEYIGSDKKGHCKWMFPSNIKKIYNTLYEACCNNNCNYVAKRIIFTGKSIYKFSASVRREVELQRKAAEHNLALPIVESWFCPERKEAVVIMPATEISLFELVCQYANDPEHLLKIIKQCLNLVSKLNKLGLTHGNAHVKNIMVYQRRFVLTNFDHISMFGRSDDQIFFLRSVWRTLVSHCKVDGISIWRSLLQPYMPDDIELDNYDTD